MAAGRRAMGAVVAASLAGLVLLVLNSDLPNVRNGLVYASVAHNIIDHGFNPIPVLANPELSYFKPIGFPFLAALPSHLFDASFGLKLLSFLGTVLFIMGACQLFLRLNRRLGIDNRLIGVQVLLLCLNPLVLYQFWSAYPDSLLAAGFLWSLVLLDRIVTDDGDARRLIPVLFLVAFGTMVVKSTGMVLLAVLPVQFFFSSRTQDLARAKKPLIVAYLLLVVLIALAFAGHNPLIGFRSSGGEEVVKDKHQFEGYIASVSEPWPMLMSIYKSAKHLLFAILLLFHVSLFLLFQRAIFDRKLVACWLAPAIYLAGLMPFGGTYYNMRYFLPAFPFIILTLSKGLHAWRGTIRVKVLLVLFVAIALVTIAVFNSRTVSHESYVLFHQLKINPRTMALDNFRMPAHLTRKRIYDKINRLEEGAVVYFVLSDYYGTARRRAMRRDGSIRADIDLRFLSAEDHALRGIKFTKKHFYLACRRYWARHPRQRFRGYWTVKFPPDSNIRVIGDNRVEYRLLEFGRR